MGYRAFGVLKITSQKWGIKSINVQLIKVFDVYLQGIILLMLLVVSSAKIDHQHGLECPRRLSLSGGFIAKILVTLVGCHAYYINRVWNDSLKSRVINFFMTYC